MLTQLARGTDMALASSTFLWNQVMIRVSELQSFKAVTMKKAELSKTQTTEAICPSAGDV